MSGDGIMKVNLPYLCRDTDRYGNERIYLRRKSQPKVRLREEPGTDAFLNEYRKALSANKAPANTIGVKNGSFGWLCLQYLKSPEFTRLATRTKKTRRNVLESICADNGSKPFAQMETRHVRSLRDAKAHVPESANAIIKALRPMFDWAIEAEIAGENPARGVKCMRVKTDGFKPWTQEEMERFERTWPTGTTARRAYLIMRWTGVRRQDAVALGRQHIKSGFIRFKIKKTGRTISVPISPELQKELDAAPNNMTFLVTDFGKPFSEAGFGNKVREWCDKAGVSKSAHGLRKARAIELAEGGATVNQLMAYFGWETATEAIRYTKAAQQKILATGAVIGHSGNRSVPLSKG